MKSKILIEEMALMMGKGQTGVCLKKAFGFSTSGTLLIIDMNPGLWQPVKAGIGSGGFFVPDD